MGRFLKILLLVIFCFFTGCAIVDFYRKYGNLKNENITQEKTEIVEKQNIENEGG